MVKPMFSNGRSSNSIKQFSRARSKSTAVHPSSVSRLAGV
jgi:hypothetical protein